MLSHPREEEKEVLTMKPTIHYDLFIIGAGPGGYAAAILGARKGLRVGLAEGTHLGGTCTNTGCIPAKTYIESINLFEQLKTAERFGIEVQTPTLTLEALNKRKTRIVARLVKGIEYLLKKAGVDIHSGYAEILGKNMVRVNDKDLGCTSLIIATGSKPKRPAMFDLPEIWTSEEIFDVTERPSSLLVVGGGVIGMELAHVFTNLGVEVTVIEALERILPTEDEEVSRELAKLSRKILFITSACITQVDASSGFKLTVESPKGTETISGQHLLLCTGREPSIPFGAKEIGILIAPSDGISVDCFMQTNIQGVYAIGDVTGGHMYAYVAAKEAAIAVDHITGGSKAMDYSAIPTVVFTNPEIASVGKRLGEMDPSSTRKGTFPVSALGRARTMEVSEGFAHIYCTQGGKIERITIMAPHATELISWATLVVSQGLLLEEFLNPHYPHPTMAELLKEASEDVLGLSIHKP
jgi:dihydrolipoamide dehydrogenase